MIFMPWNWSFSISNKTNVLHEYKFQAKQPWGEFYVQQAAAGLIGEGSAYRELGASFAFN